MKLCLSFSLLPGLVLFLPLFFFSCQPEGKQVTESETPVQQIALTLPYTLPLNAQTLRGDTTITLAQDLFFKEEKSYQAFSLRQTLLPWVEQLADTTDLDVIFTCSDGYEPSMPLATVLANEGFLAYQDLDQTGQPWPDSVAEKFAPYYLVWTHLKGPEAGFHWPYGLVSIRFNQHSTEFAAATPTTEAALPGFALFKNNCMKCHSINKVGGELGPEFNYPQNITEYWDKETIWAFVRAPQSFRYNSKMPPQPGLSREDFDAIYAYLIQMKEQKIGA